MSVRSIFVVRAICRGNALLLSEPFYIPRTIVWGFFHTLKRAKEAVLANETDMFEQGYYQYAVISSIPPGLCSEPNPIRGVLWFEFSKNTVSEIEPPLIADRRVWGL